MEEKFAISIYVCNKPGVLVRLAQTFARRGYNVDSLVVSPAHDTNFSRITVVVQGEPSTYDQIIRQLNKLVDVVHAKSHDSTDVVDREMAFFKVKVDSKRRQEIFQCKLHSWNRMDYVIVNVRSKVHLMERKIRRI